jgi:glycosyltransferase involved in cell wall biosynthesis
MRAYLRRIAPADLFVVHTLAAAQVGQNWLPRPRLLRLGWPAASLAEVADRFAASAPPTDREPYALLIGDARDAKGIHVLLTALEDGGPLLRIVGQQLDGVEESLRHRYPATRVDWVTGWVSRSPLTEAISGAAVVVFPYLDSFGRHGGVSGALAQALTFAKPIVATTVLADQLPQSAACRLIEPGDTAALRYAIQWAIRNTTELHLSARATFEYVRRWHTYDFHLERILERVLELSPPRPR